MSKPSTAELLAEFDCLQTYSGRSSADRKKRKQRDNVLDARTYFEMEWLGDRPTSKEEMAKRVETRFRTSFPPIVGWLMWQAISALVNRVVFWLWDRYNDG